MAHPVNIFILGIGSDKLCLWLAARNGGIRKPEHRLVILVVPLVIGLAANVGFGVLAQHYLVTGGSQPHRFSLVFIFALQYMAFGGILEVMYTYIASTVSPARSLEAMTAISCIRDLVSFGLSYGIVGFVEKTSYQTSYGIYGGLIAFEVNRFLVGCENVLYSILDDALETHIGQFLSKFLQMFSRVVSRIALPCRRIPRCI